MTERAPAPPPGFPAGLPPSPGLASGYPARRTAASQSASGTAPGPSGPGGVAVLDQARPGGPSSPFNRGPVQSPFAHPQSGQARPGTPPGPPPQSPFTRPSEHASPFTAPPGTTLPPPSPSPFAPASAVSPAAFAPPPGQTTGAAGQQAAFPPGPALPIRARPRAQGPLYAGRPAASLRPMPFTPLVAQPSSLTAPPPRPQSAKADNKGPLIAGALVVVAVVSVVAMFAFSSNGGGGQAPKPPSPFGSHTVEELAGYLPVQAPDGWTIVSEQSPGPGGLVDGLGPENGSSPVDPSMSTNPSDCAQPIKPESVAWAAKALIRSKVVNTITNLPDSVVVMIGVQRSGSDAIAEYRSSLSSKCLNYTFTNPQTSASVAVRQELIGNKSFPNADASLGVKVAQDEEPRRGLLNWVTVALKHDIVVKTMASEYNSTDLADTDMSAILQKVAQPALSAPK
ncbi:hypothetical protein [Segniliparus rugosus]|uniref:hypothetical protein n=1 Tax=Segniliparus rugosus TaxID=286804 RepID=UPI00058F7E51|nr:hypothetical protein [Segniliparus rugosus]